MFQTKLTNPRQFNNKEKIKLITQDKVMSHQTKPKKQTKPKEQTKPSNQIKQMKEP